MKETFGQRFQRLRKTAGLTQEDIATKLNITAQAVSKWENDVSSPDISVLVELSDILGVSLDELLGKATDCVTVVPSEQRKKLENMFFKIKCVSSDGDKVNVNIPLVLAKMFVDGGMAMPQVNGFDFSKINFAQLINLIEQGVVGKLIEVEGSEGDNVEVWVE